MTHDEMLETQQLLKQAGLREEQLLLEEESVGLGIERYQKAVEQDQSNTRPGKKLVVTLLEPLIAAIQEQQAIHSSGKAGRDTGVWKFLGQFSPQQLAFITAKVCINGISRTTPLVTLAKGITQTLESTLNHETLKEEDIGAYLKIQERLKQSSNQGYRTVVLKKAMKHAGVQSIKWGMSERLKSGMLLIKLLESATGAILITKVVMGHNNTPFVVMPTEKTARWLQKSHEYSELLMPIYQPMITKPREWSTPTDGGYLTTHLGLEIIKKGTTKPYMEELANWDMPVVYRAINAVQGTQWAVNGAVLRILEEVWDQGGSLGKIPPRDPIPLPAQNLDKADMTEDEFKAWKKTRVAVYEENVRLESKRFSMFQLIDMAKKFLPRECIYFVYNMDWRGRIYPLSSYLNPQGNDVAKALLQLSKGKPLGETGAAWLAVHGANSYGQDKVSFDERIQWVLDNQDAILDSAANPLDGERFWVNAENPWQFLAFCLEWMGYTMQGTEYVSHLAVGLDGSCNGLQNFSAMLRDQIGGKATNLVPSEKPSDIYSEVASVAQFRVNQDTHNQVPYADLWYGKVNRKIAKRPSMTLSYGATRYGFGDQLRETIRKLNDESTDGTKYLGECDEFKACVYMAGVLYEAIGSVVVAARQAMDWLQEVARVVAQNGLPIQWETPAGLLVSQNYRKSLGNRLDMVISGQRIQLLVNYEGTEIDVRRNAAGISPNFIHSLDASHMMLTVNHCLDAGITDFAMVHDSYGTHAADVGLLGEVLRDAFIEQYSGNVLEDFRNQILRQLPEAMHKKVPEVPPMGTLDLEAIRDSEYFFA